MSVLERMLTKFIVDDDDDEDDDVNQDEDWNECNDVEKNLCSVKWSDKKMENVCDSYRMVWYMARNEGNKLRTELVQEIP